MVLKVDDFKGREVVFTRQKWKEKKADHPELGDKTFLKNLKRCIMKPDQVWENHGDKRKECYYRRYSQRSYVKAVVFVEDNPCRVVTAYSIDKIKEADYPGLKKIL